MKRAIFVTGVSGSGKTTVCNSLTKLGYEAYDIESMPGMFRLVDSNTNEILRDKQLSDLTYGFDADWVCDIPKLKDLIANQTSELAFYCGGTSRTEELMQVFDSTVILQVSDETTAKRLSVRGVNEFGNTQTAREWVLSWKKEVEADWLAAGGISVSAEPEPDAVAKTLADICCDDLVYQEIDTKHPKLVFLNGKTSSGKTTLANRLREKYNCAVIELDEVVYGLECPPGKNRFIEAYQKRDYVEFTQSFVEAVQSEIRSALNTHSFVIIEGAIVNIETLNEIISEWRESFLFIFLDLKNIEVYTERLRNRFMLSSTENRNGLPELFWEKFDLTELEKYYASQKVTSGIENSIHEYAVESIKASEVRLAAFSTEFKNILKIEV